jgi:hypothetical protein
MDEPSVTTQPSPCQDPLPDILLCGGIAILAGAPNIGKTALLAGMLRDLSRGLPIFGIQPAKIPAIGFIAADRGWMRGAGVWFERAGYPEIHHYSLLDDPSFNSMRLNKHHERVQLLAEFVDKLSLPRGSLVAVDPMSLFLGGNMLDYDVSAKALIQIQKIILMPTSLAMICTAHTAKLKADKRERYARVVDQTYGSTGIGGHSDTMMYLAGPHETGKAYHEFTWHPHKRLPATFKLEQDEQGLFRPYQGLIALDTSKHGSVLALFPPDGATMEFGALVVAAQQIPVSRRTVKRVLEELMAAGAVEHVGHGLYRRATVQ